MDGPLVSVICLCYNQSTFVREAVESVVQQTYAPIQLIVVDDYSTDNSVEIINELIKEYPFIEFLPLSSNYGNCKAFNIGFALAKGKYIIDLAADDVLMPDRVEVGVNTLEKTGNEYGVTFSDAQFMDEQGNPIGLHSEKHPHATIPSGDVYKEVIERYFICSPTTMFRKSVMDSLHGYDESLAFEDFDFWIRASRHYKFIYTPTVLVKKREVSNSMSTRQFEPSNPQRWSTFEVCKKIMFLNRNKVEATALKKRIWYELSVSFRALDFKLAYSFWKLLRSI